VYVNSHLGDQFGYLAEKGNAVTLVKKS